jgi:hypothetical protein
MKVQYEIFHRLMDQSFETDSERSARWKLAKKNGIVGKKRTR